MARKTTGKTEKEKEKMAKKKRYCFAFEEGDGTNKKLLGGKGAGLCSMTQIGLPVPPGFVVTTEANVDYLERDKFPEGLMDEVHEFMEDLEKENRQGLRRPHQAPVGLGALRLGPLHAGYDGHHFEFRSE